MPLRIALMIGFILFNAPIIAAPVYNNPIPIYTNKTYVHYATHLTFPPVLATFVRVGILRFDNSANDIGVAYNSLNSNVPISINIYVYPKTEIINKNISKSDAQEADKLLQQNRLNQIKNEILTAEPNAKLIKEGNIILQSHKVKMLTYNYENNRTTAYLLSNRNWFLEYRITYPAWAPNTKDSILAFSKKDITTFFNLKNNI